MSIIRFLSKRKLFAIDKRLYMTVYDSSSVNSSSRNTVSFLSLTIMSLYAKHSAAFIPLAVNRKRGPAWQKKTGEEVRDKRGEGGGGMKRESGAAEEAGEKEQEMGGG